MNFINHCKIALFVAVTTSLNLANAEQHAHRHESSADNNAKETLSSQHAPLAAITLNNGNKWAIDNSLHIGMTRIKSEIEIHLNAIHLNTLKSKQYHLLASNIQQHLRYLFTHCKLPSDADEQLHALLYSIMQGTEEISASANKRAGAIEIINALQRYPQYFNDVNWQPLSH